MKINPSNIITLTYEEYLEKHQSILLIFSFYFFHMFIIIGGIILRHYGKLGLKGTVISPFTIFRLVSLIPIFIHLYYYIQKNIFKKHFKIINLTQIGTLYIFIITITSSLALLSSSLSKECNMVLCENINSNNLQPFLLFQNIIIPIIAPVLVKTHYKSYVFLGLVISFISSITSAIVVHATPTVYFGLFATYFLVSIVIYDHEMTLFKLYQNYLDQESQFLLRYRAQCEAELSLKKEEEMRQILGNVTADLKLPMNTLSNEIDSLLNQFSDSVIICDSLNKLKSVSNYVLMILQRNIDYSKVLSGIPLLPTYELVNLEECIESVMTNASYTTKSIPIYFDSLPDHISSYITTDKRWFQDNLLCLLNNAIKLSLKGSIIIRCDLIPAPFPLSIPTEISNYMFEVASEMIKIEVEHLGTGLESNNYSDLFQLSYQTNEKFGESGLGLFSISKRSEALGGMCGGNHRSDGLNGACFWFSFPYHPDSIISPLTSLSLTNHPHHPSNDYYDILKNCTIKINRENATDNNDIITNEDNLIESNVNIRELKQEKHVNFEKIGYIKDIKKNEEINEEKSNNEMKPFFEQHLINKNYQYSEENKNINIIDGTQLSPSTLLLLNQQTLPSPYFIGKSFLIVDDSIVIQKTTTETLVREGFEVFVAKHGKECIQMLQKRRYDYILMDIQMPIMNGIETTQYIRQYEMEWLTPSLNGNNNSNDNNNNNSTNHRPDEEWGQLPSTITYNRHIIIGYITTQNNEMIDKLLSIGMDDVLYKPLDVMLLRSCLNKLSTIDITRVLE